MLSSFRPCLLLAFILTAGCAAHPPPSGALAAHTTAASPAVRQLQADLSAVFGAQVTAHGTWAVDVRSLRSGETLYRLNAEKLMMPASNMKIVTMAAAAEVLGWNHRFTTTLETFAPIVDGVLEGDLIVRGTGDPTINNREQRSIRVLDDWAAALRQAGISRIAGRVVGDDQAFDDEGIGAGWAWDYLQYGYAAPVGALQFNENVATLGVRPGAVEGAPADVTLTAGSGFVMVNRTFTGPADSPETIDYRRRLDRPVLEITGSVPLASGEQTRVVARNVAVVNPTEYFVQSLKDGLVARGITVAGEAVDMDDIAAELVSASLPDRRVLATAESPTLHEMGIVLMKVSQNLYAETLLKAAGAARGGLGTAPAGRRAFASVLEGWGIPPDTYVMYDGSGLSRYNYLTAAGLTNILERMQRDDRHRDAFAATLPIAGQDGTLSMRMRGSLADGNALAKTGSIANVRALSGYVQTRDGEPLVFSMLTNDFVVPSATVNWMADLGVEILAGFSRR
ncbi:D-alanyl-D-alanine carboxypeptidase/D-alanyl-D-alanine-endopeptidase [soil metagenome]|nr:D-alanyl-D-alanine carboxypeptidase/D-alanyl-D-alanine-endopeptidase [Acidobacteriota bacterium]